MDYLRHLLNNILSFDNIVVKTIVAVWLYFAGIHTYLIANPILLVLDAITGVYSSIKKGNKFTSRYLKKGLLEKLGLCNSENIKISLKSMMIASTYFST